MILFKPKESTNRSTIAYSGRLTCPVSCSNNFICEVTIHPKKKIIFLSDKKSEYFCLAATLVAREDHSFNDLYSPSGEIGIPNQKKTLKMGIFISAFAGGLQRVDPYHRKMYQEGK